MQYDDAWDQFQRELDRSTEDARAHGARSGPGQGQAGAIESMLSESGLLPAEAAADSIGVESAGAGDLRESARSGVETVILAESGVLLAPL